MIITSTPYRCSFFGGGTDYPDWYRENGGAVLSTTIDKYCYISVRYLPPFFEHKFRIVYSKLEHTQSIDEILHPVVRACLEYMEIGDGVEIHHDGDLPKRSGMATSSAFTVGLLSALHELIHAPINRGELAREAIHIERDVLQESVGSQDQVAVTYGGINKITFVPNGDFTIQPIHGYLPELNEHLLLLYTGLPRTASDIARTYERKRELHIVDKMVDEALGITPSGITDFGRLLDESWKLKQQLSPLIATPELTEIYEKAKSAGAIGGKMLGAGGGGFMLLFAEPELHKHIISSLGLLHVPFHFEGKGSQIIFSSND